MRAIINGFRYDTEKAELIGAQYNEDVPQSDFGHWWAELYVSPRARRFFLAGEGHAMTAFARCNEDGSRGWGERIIPLTKREALEWAEQNLDLEDDEYDRYFGDIIEDA